MPIEKSTSQYYNESLVDPKANDVEIDLPEDYSEDDVVELEDGSAIVGGGFDEEEMPPIEEAPHMSNLVTYFDDDELNVISQELIQAWEDDNESRSEWKAIYSKGLDLLGMDVEDRSEPFEGASGVHHPLLAEAVVQFQAQAYKELLPAAGPVSTKVLGVEDDKRIAQANRVQDFMNYLIVDVMEEYDANMDQLLFYLPLSGSAFKKTYFDPLKERTVSIFVTADHITVPYSATDLNDAPRIIHDFVMTGNDLLKYQENGFYADTHIPEAGTVTRTETDEATDELIGIQPGEFTYNEEYVILEGHLNLDHEKLNTDGGVALPFIVTLEKESGVILAIRKNFQEQDPLFKRLDFFTHYKFLPGLGFYGFGLIHMIGGLTKSVTSILRQLIDAGTFANLPGGFKAKGIRVAGEDDPIAPGEWRDIDTPGGALRDALVPLPYKEPSATLAALLGSLVESGQRFASIADMQVGDTSGQQQPVGTTIAMLERGTKVMSSIHKRLHKAQKHEFKILARLIFDSLPEGQPYPYATQQSAGQIMKTDFDDRVDVIPVSDPNIFSMAQRIMLATQQLQMATAAPEIHNLKEAYRRMYVAMNIDDYETLLKPEDKPKPLTPLQEHRRVFENKKLEPVEQMNHKAHLKAHLAFLKHPALQGNFEFAANLIQDIMGHVMFLAKQQAQQTQGDVMQIEADMFDQLMPQIIPPKDNSQIRLQERQLDIEEQAGKEKRHVDMREMGSKERIEKAKLSKDAEELRHNANRALEQLQQDRIIADNKLQVERERNANAGTSTPKR